MSSELEEGRSLIVVEATNPPDGTTRYIDQVVTFADPDIEFRYLSWRTLAMRHLDVIHLHWPEVLLRASGRFAGAVRKFMFVLLLGVLKLRKVAIVRTLHNLRPHEDGGEVERRLLSALDGMTTLFVTINPVTKVDGESVYIPHGHYRDRFAMYPRAEPVPNRVVHAGLIRPYKGIERLIQVAAELSPSRIQLRIVGKPTNELRLTVEDAAQDNSHITARLEFVPDADLVEEITSAQLVCLPYEELHNSGMLLVALSLGRPVLVPESPTTMELAREAGEAWVIRYTGELTTTALASALDATAALDMESGPQLADRDWDRVGAAYSEAFRLARRLKMSGRVGFDRER